MAEALEAPVGRPGGVLAATKLHIPGVRPELVARQALVDELVASTGRRLSLIEAPAGYGKTTLLAEWRSSPAESREYAWLSLDEGDSDPVRFWSGVMDALRRIERGLGEATLSALATRNVDLLDVALPLLVNDLAALPRPTVLVLDDYQTVRGDPVHRSVDFLLRHLPPRLHLVIATRIAPPLSLARLRAAGEMVELRASDLRFSEAEAADLLRRTVGLELSDDDVSRLHARTEGWPAGLYLAGLSLRGREDPSRFIASFAGDDRHIVDYLSAEVLADQPPELRAFLLRTSILDRLCGPLCDAVAEIEGSARLLERIERRNLFLIPLDTTRTWYRYHRLLGELLRHELELSDPAAIADLHRRASDWHLREGSVPEAIEHAQAAGEVKRARDLVALHWNDYFNRGLLATVERWLDAFGEPAAAEDPRLDVARAWLALDRGRLEAAGRWIERATRALAGAVGGAGGEVAADVSVLRAVHGFKAGELDRGLEAAREALDLAPRGSFPHTVAQLILGVTLYWRGEPERAAEVLDSAANEAAAAGNDLGRSYALGYLGLIEVDSGDPTAAERLGREAVEASDAPGFAGHFVLMVGHLARGRAAELDGRLEAAEAAIRRAVELAGRGAGRLEIAASLLALAELRHLRADRDEARATLRKATAIIADCAQPGALAASVATAERRLRTAPRAPASGASTNGEELTERETAVLRLLASGLSRGEIADALYVSANTVKTHAKAIYRKLDASSRAEAVARARQLGLL